PTGGQYVDCFASSLMPGTELCYAKDNFGVDAVREMHRAGRGYGRSSEQARPDYTAAVKEQSNAAHGLSAVVAGEAVATSATAATCSTKDHVNPRLSLRRRKPQQR